MFIAKVDLMYDEFERKVNDILFSIRELGSEDIDLDTVDRDTDSVL